MDYSQDFPLDTEKSFLCTASKQDIKKLKHIYRGNTKQIEEIGNLKEITIVSKIVLLTSIHLQVESFTSWVSRKM